MTSPLRWFITGASTGFGRTFAEVLLAQGDHVVATARDKGAVADLVERYPDAALALPLDVTDPEQVREAVAAATEAGPVDVLVNNAGHGLLGALEELSDEQIQQVLGVNLLGALAVTRAVLPHMRARRSGHIVQMSSVGGVVANPGHAVYATTKFALEGASEALAGEVAPFGIHVLIVEPGPFRTDFLGRSLEMATPIADYQGGPAGALRARFATQHGLQPGDPVLAIETIIGVVRAGSAPLRLPLGHAAVQRIREKLQRQLDDLEAYADLSMSTDRPVG
ncbi:oxidoreductase [Pseudonocardia sp.]|jgi:NAD(P)-dependent dehydrogenase (short-subunit alcohol dehydrogenase family)|uniref:oxidoreductase n=1 Tax=Pseudonocardia sp. TaxID=60912 RepID=UPI002D9271DD|nr:oxidoreductase [Pseudonocardia sp.]